MNLRLGWNTTMAACGSSEDLWILTNLSTMVLTAEIAPA